MPITTAYETQIDHVSILDEHGVFDETLGQDLISEDQLPAIMEHLVFCRQLDETAFKLQRSGRMGTYPQNTGQEMPSLAAALAIENYQMHHANTTMRAGLLARKKSLAAAIVA